MPRAKAKVASGPKKLLKRFRPEEKITNDSLVVINGRPKSGKTTVLVDFVAASAPIFDGILLVTESSKCIQSFLRNKHIPLTSYIHVVQSVDLDDPLPNQMVWADAERYIEKVWIPNIRKRYDKYVARGKDPLYYGLVLDDLSFDKKRLEAPWMMNLYSNHRQLGVVPIVICQDMFQFPSGARGMISLAVTFRTVQLDQLQKLHKNYFNILSFAEFKKVLAKATEPPAHEPQRRGCLIMDFEESLMVGEENVMDCLYWFRADINTTNKNWHVGNPLYFAAAEQVHTALRTEPLPILVPTVEALATEANTVYDDTAMLAEPGPDSDDYDPTAIYLEDEDDDTNSVFGNLI